MPQPTKTSPKREGGRLSAADRKAQILDAARGAFIESGFSGTRTRDIAERAGVNEALLYKHFASKEEMFEAAIAQPLEELINEVVDLVPANPSPDEGTDVQRERTARYLGQLLEIMLDVAPLFGAILFADRERGQAFYRDRYKPFLDAVSKTVASGLPAWQHRDFDPERITTATVGMTLGIALDSHFAGTEVGDPAELAAQLTDILFDGLRPREG